MILVAGVEVVVKSRPLTSVTFVENIERLLSPNDLLLLNPDFKAETGTADAYSKHWKRIQFYADQFWKRWVKEFLPTLLPRSKWLELKRNVSINDVVLIVDENSPRSQWALKQIVKTYSKGIIRTVSTYLQEPGVQNKNDPFQKFVSLSRRGRLVSDLSIFLLDCKIMPLPLECCCCLCC